MATDKQHAAFYKVMDAKTPKVDAWFAREDAKLKAAEEAIKARRLALEDARSDKLKEIERAAFSAMRNIRD